MNQQEVRDAEIKARQEARDAEIKARQDMRLYNKVYRENNKERLRQYEKERYQKRKSVVN